MSCVLAYSNMTWTSATINALSTVSFRYSSFIWVYTESINASNLIWHITPEQDFPNSVRKPNGYFAVICQLKLDPLLSSVDHFFLKSISHKSRSHPLPTYDSVWEELTLVWTNLGDLNFFFVNKSLGLSTCHGKTPDLLSGILNSVNSIWWNHITKWLIFSTY